MADAPSRLTGVPLRIITGFFQVGINYATFRSNGTSDWLLIYTVGGAGDVGFAPRGAGRSSGKIMARPGDAVLMRPGTFHEYGTHRAAGQWDLLWAHFHPRADWQPWLDWPLAEPGYPGLFRLQLPDSPLQQRVEAALRRMHTLAIGAHRRREELALNALEEAMLWCASVDPAARPAGHDARIVAAEEYICQHLRGDLTLPAVAAAVGLSESRLSHLFRQQTGTTPQAYVESHRVGRARTLLERTSMSVQQIATEVGYPNPFYFALRFKRQTGQSPTQYRAANRV